MAFDAWVNTGIVVAIKRSIENIYDLRQKAGTFDRYYFNIFNDFFLKIRKKKLW